MRRQSWLTPTSCLRSTESPIPRIRYESFMLQKCLTEGVPLTTSTFGVAQNEVFALLGPNGAGKTTLMGLIRGELNLSESRGDVLVGGTSLSKNLASIRSRLGFCPQFDAINTMTVTEHLRLYARIKGVRNTNTNVQHILQLMGLVPFANRLGAELSGGYKRRLSLGIALIGENSKTDFVPRQEGN